MHYTVHGGAAGLLAAVAVPPCIGPGCSTRIWPSGPEGSCLSPGSRKSVQGIAKRHFLMPFTLLFSLTPPEVILDNNSID